MRCKRNRRVKFSRALADIIPAVRPILTTLILLLLTTACSTAPTPTGPPVAPAPPPTSPAATRQEEQVTGTVYVTASALNVREEPNADAELITQVKKNAALEVVGRGEGWVRVKLADGRSGWVAERFVSETRQQQARTPQARAQQGKRGCESDFAFLETPVLDMSDRGVRGLVVVDATVNTKGVVTATKVVSNTTGDKSAAAVAEREIRSAKFAPPIRNCQPRSFIFTYRRTF